MWIFLDILFIYKIEYYIYVKLFFSFVRVLISKRVYFTYLYLLIYVYFKPHTENETTKQATWSNQCKQSLTKYTSLTSKLESKVKSETNIKKAELDL